MFDVNKLTVGEVAKVEELSGQSIAAFGTDAPMGNMLGAIAFVVKRREDRKFTWNDAMALTMTEVNEIIGVGEAEDEADPLELPSPQPEAKSPQKRGKK